MAKIVTRVWTSRGPTGKRVRHVSYGYHAMIAGQRVRCVPAEWSTEAEALEALNRRLADAAAGRTPKPAAEATLGALAEEYLRYKTARGKRSLHEDRRIIDKRLLPEFGATRPVRQLTAGMIARYEQRRAGEVGACTVCNELTVLRHMLRLGRRWEYLDAVPEIEMPKKPEPRQRYLEPAEIERLLAACARSKNHHLGTIVTVVLNTGMRLGEVMGLAWERVDLASARLTLYRTKSGKPRGVPMNRDVYDALVALEPDAARRVGPLFARRDGTAWGQIRNAFATAMDRAEVRGFRFHDLRHTFASHYMMRGGSLYDLKDILGHADIAMTMRYAHLSPQHLRVGVERLEGLAAGRPMAHEMAQSARMSLAPGDSRRATAENSSRAPVAQVDRAAVS
jgi:integrase